MPRFIDLSGHKFSRLTALRRVPRPSTAKAGTFWRCLCDCGKESTVVAHALTRNCIKSCGCIQRPQDLTGQTFAHWFVEKLSRRDERGRYLYHVLCLCGERRIVASRELQDGNSTSCGCRQKLPPGMAARNMLMGLYKKCATKRKLAWALDRETFFELTTSDCRYCGTPPAQIHKAGIGHGGECIYNGVDRVDSTKGYLTENAVPCCKVCNFAKRTMSVNDFMAWVRRVHAHCASSYVPMPELLFSPPIAYRFDFDSMLDGYEEPCMLV
jgi:hypothetical protein